jgi:hypothetical protein
MKSVDRSDRKLSLRGEILRAGVFSKSNKNERWPRHRLPSGRTRPINGERTGPWPFPGKPPGQPPEQHHQRRRSTRGFSRSNLRRRQIVRGDRRGSRSSTHAPDEQGRRLAPDGTTVWTKTEHSSYAEKSREPELPELPGKAEPESRKKPRLRTTPTRSRGTRPTGTIPVPCVTKLQRKLARRGAVRGHNRLQKYPDRGQRCQAAVPCPSRSSLPAASRAQRGKSGEAPLARFPQP